MKRAIVLLGAMPLAGCALFQPVDTTVVVAETPRPMIAHECTDPDSEWIELPDADVLPSTAARNYRDNKRQYGELIARRRICRASLKAQFPGKG